MNKDKILLLPAEIDKCFEQLEKLFSYYSQAKEDLNNYKQFLAKLAEAC